MTSMISIGPSSVLPVQKLDTKRYVGLKPFTSRKFVDARCLSKLPRTVSLIRASDEREVSIKSSGKSIEECEAAVVAGNAPEAPPLRPKPVSPAGTPAVPLLPLTRRPRRNRKSPALRAAFQETSLSPANFVLPLFIHEGEEDTPIGAMPGCYRLGWRHGLVEEVYKARDVGINSVVLFPKIPDALKSPIGDEAYNENGLVHRAIRLLKDKYPDIVIYTDVALDPYSSDGHDGIVREDASHHGKISDPVMEIPQGRVIVAEWIMPITKPATHKEHINEIITPILDGQISTKTDEDCWLFPEKGDPSI